jgi:GNAT superfamily N-acetyltransferase
MKVEIEPVAFAEKEVLRQMMELYQYDFSEIDGTDLDAHGRYGYRWLDHYWTEAGRHPFFIRANGRLAGFVLVRARDDDPAADREAAEFFVLRRYRGHGVGESWRPGCRSSNHTNRGHAETDRQGGRTECPRS